jgi:hypothetical protein
LYSNVLITNQGIGLPVSAENSKKKIKNKKNRVSKLYLFFTISSIEIIKITPTNPKSKRTFEKKDVGLIDAQAPS